MRLVRFDIDQWGEIADSLLRNKMRTFLTAFGIFWGIFMLLLLMGGGRGMEEMLVSNFSGFATNSGFIISGSTEKPYRGFRKGRRWNIVLDDVEHIRHAVPEAEVVTPSESFWGRDVQRGTGHCEGSIMGVYPEYSIVDSPEIIEGRDINAVDVAQRRKVCVIGKRIREELFKTDEQACGQTVRVDGIHYTVVGVGGKSEGGMSINGDATTAVRVPYSTLQRAYNIGNHVDFLCLTARKGYAMSYVQEKAAAVIKRAHQIHPDDRQAVNMINAEAMFSMIDELFGGISILVWMIGVGTLLGGIIGVSNIMVVTVKERTTEIGIRRAIGATSADILFMIMSESVVLTLVAGMSGISLAVLILYVVESSLPQGTDATFQITFAMATGAAAILSFLGVLAGLAPAYRALHIKPVDAMREE